MILVIGGSYQGKLEYARKLPEYKGLLDSSSSGISCADGGLDCYDQAWRCSVIDGFHNYVRRILKQGDTTVDKFISSILEKNPDAIIIMDEIGYGIVPIDPIDREYRETVGLVGQRLVREALQVHRVIGGIGIRIK